MNENPAQDVSSSASHGHAETHCPCHSPASGNRALAIALLFCGILGVAAGTACLMWLANPEIGVNPFTRLESGDLAQSFIAIRRMAFLTIALGLAAFLTGIIARPRQPRVGCAD